MASSDDVDGGVSAANPGPFVVSHPCPACHGRGCPTCHGTGVARFYHGTKADLSIGDLIKPGHTANYGKLDRTTTYVYLTGTLDAATWGAELALGEGRGRIYIVEPVGAIEDDPNLTDKKFPGNPTRSYRSREPSARHRRGCGLAGALPRGAEGHAGWPRAPEATRRRTNRLTVVPNRQAVIPQAEETTALILAPHIWRIWRHTSS